MLCHPLGGVSGGRATDVYACPRRAEVIEGVLPPGASIGYDGPPVPGLEQHVWALDGRVEITVQGDTHLLAPGDCLRFRLRGPSRFHCPGPAPARYAIVLVLP
jgi:hypothetical protein